QNADFNNLCANAPARDNLPNSALHATRVARSHDGFHVEQLFCKRTHNNPSIEPYLSLSQISSLTLRLPRTQGPEPQGIDLSRLTPTQDVLSFPHSLHLILGPPVDMYPSLLSLLRPTHLTISREPHLAGKLFAYFPMFRQLDRSGATDTAFLKWTTLKSINLVDCYPLSSGSLFQGRFIFEPVMFVDPVEITMDFSKAGPKTGLEEMHLRLLFMNCVTKGLAGVNEIKKLVVKVGSEEQRAEVEAGRAMVGGVLAVDEAEVRVVMEEEV
ncbi:hypothetical protein P7C70_g9547, partial [Phenoliferia sp. Uapishka_3]